MLTVSHRKTYTLTVQVDKSDDEYAMIKDAMECRDSESEKLKLILFKECNKNVHGIHQIQRN